jgi:MAPEG family
MHNDLVYRCAKQHSEPGGDQREVNNRAGNQRGVRLDEIILTPPEPYWILLFAALLPIVCAGIAKWGVFGKSRKEGGYDNHSPRQWLERQSGWRARANAAQANTFEALPFFFATVTVDLLLI